MEFNILEDTPHGKKYKYALAVLQSAQGKSYLKHNAINPLLKLLADAANDPDNRQRSDLTNDRVCVASFLFNDCKCPIFNYMSYIPDELFFDCDNLLGSPDKGDVLFIPNTISQIGNRAFASCKNLKHVDIEDNDNIRLGIGVFKNCTNLETVVFGEGIKVIPRDTFDGCTSLKKVYLPSTVRIIDNNVFTGCPAEFEIILDRETAKNIKCANGAELRQHLKINGQAIPPEPEKNDTETYINNVESEDQELEVNTENEII